MAHSLIVSFLWVVIHDDEEWFAVFSDSPPLKFEGSGSATTIFRPEWTFMEPLRTLCTAQSEIASCAHKVTSVHTSAHFLSSMDVRGILPLPSPLFNSNQYTQAGYTISFPSDRKPLELQQKFKFLNSA